MKTTSEITLPALPHVPAWVRASEKCYIPIAAQHVDFDRLRNEAHEITPKEAQAERGDKSAEQGGV